MKSVRIIAGVGAVAIFVLSSIAGAEEKPEAEAKESAKSGVVTNAAAGFPADAPVVAQMNAEFMRKVMETSTRIEAVKEQIAERQSRLYESNPEIGELYSQIIEMQKTINKILDEDKELAELKMKRDILWSTMPSLPKSKVRVFPPKVIKANTSFEK